jgi:hypothetical protein
VLFVVIVLLAALAIGAARGGTLDRLGRLPLRRPLLVVAALACQLAGTVVGSATYPLGLALSAALIAWFLALNRSVVGLGMVGAGLVLNALVVGLNGAMPVSVDASGRAGISTQDILSGADARHELADGSTHLRVLGDVIPVVLPVRPEVVSPGDVLIAAGLAQLVVVAMGSGSRGRRPADR